MIGGNRRRGKFVFGFIYMFDSSIDLTFKIFRRCAFVSFKRKRERDNYVIDARIRWPQINHDLPNANVLVVRLNWQPSAS